MRFCLIGRDRDVESAVASTAARLGAAVDVVGTLEDLGFVGRLTSYALLLVDERAPGGDALETVRTAATLTPALPVLLLVDGDRPARLLDELPRNVFRLVYRSSALALTQAIEDALAHVAA